MSDNAYLQSNKAIDTDNRQTLALMDHRVFNGIDISTGWEDSIDGIGNYSIDVILPELSDGTSIGFQYAPWIVVPYNTDPTCHPGNFLTAKTIGLNRIRIYAAELPNALNMLPVNIEMRMSNSQLGGTNAYERPEVSSTFERTNLTIKGESHLVQLTKDNLLLEDYTAEIFIKGSKGEGSVLMEFKGVVDNGEYKNILFDLRGNPVSVPESSVVKTSLGQDGLFISITLPKDLHFATKQLYFVLPISPMEGAASRIYYVRSSIYTRRIDREDKLPVVYSLSMPNLTRVSSSNFRDNETGEIALNSTIKIYKTDWEGQTKPFTPEEGEFVELQITNLTSELSQAFYITGFLTKPTAKFFGSNGLDYKIEILVNNEIRNTIYYTIGAGVNRIVALPSSEYLTSFVQNNKYNTPGFSISLYVVSIDGKYVPYRGNVKVKKNVGSSSTLIFSTPPLEVYSSYDIPSFEYDDLPSSLSIEVYEPGSSIAAYTTPLLIYREGDINAPSTLVSNPPLVILPSDFEVEPNGAYIATFSVFKGQIDITENYDFSVSTPLSLVVSIDENRLRLLEIGSNFDFSDSVKITASSRLSGEEVVQTLTILQNKPVDSRIIYRYFIDNVEFKELTPTIEINGLWYEADEIGFPKPGWEEDPDNSGMYTWISLKSGETSIPPSNNFQLIGPSQISGFNQGEFLGFDPSIAYYEIANTNPNSEYVINSVIWQYLSSEEKWVAFEDLSLEDSERIGVQFKNNNLFKNQTRTVIRAILNYTENSFSFVEQIVKDLTLSYSENQGILASIKGLNLNGSTFHTFKVDKRNNVINDWIKEGDRYIENYASFSINAYKGDHKLNFVKVAAASDEFQFTSASSGATFEIDYSGEEAIAIKVIGISKLEGSSILNFITGDGLQFSTTFSWFSEPLLELTPKLNLINLNKDRFVSNKLTQSQYLNWSLNSISLLEENWFQPIKYRLEISQGIPTNIYLQNTSDVLLDLRAEFVSNDESIRFIPYNLYKNGRAFIDDSFDYIVAQASNSLLTVSYYSNLLELYEEDLSGFSADLSIENNGQYKYKKLSVPPGTTEISLSREVIIFAISKNTLSPISEEDASIIFNDYFYYDIGEYSELVLTSKLPSSIYFTNESPNASSVIRFESNQYATERTIFRELTYFENLKASQDRLEKLLKDEVINQSAINEFNYLIAGLDDNYEELYERYSKGEQSFNIPDSKPTEGRLNVEFLKTDDYYELDIFNESLFSDINPELFAAIVAPNNSKMLLNFKFQLKDIDHEEPIEFILSFYKGSSIMQGIPVSKRLILEDDNIVNYSIILETSESDEQNFVNQSLLNYLSAYGVENNLELNSSFMKLTQNKTTESYWVGLSLEERFKDLNLSKDNLRLVGFNYQILNINQTGYRNPYENVISMLPQIKNHIDAFKESVSIIESALNDDPDKIINLPVSSGSKVITNSALLTQYGDSLKLIRMFREILNVADNEESLKATLQIKSSSSEYTISFSDSDRDLSTLRVTSEGTLIAGNKHMIIGSTSIGSLYGKKMVIGKEIEPDDIRYDKGDTDGLPLPQGYKRRNEGVLAVWSQDVWSSYLDNTGHYFLRYNSDRDMIGYMVMDKNQIAAKRFKNPILAKDQNKFEPIQVDSSLYPQEDIFSIKETGHIMIKDLEAQNTAIFSNRVKVQPFNSAFGRRGIVFVGVMGGED